MKKKILNNHSILLNDNIIDYIKKIYNYKQLSQKEELKIINNYYHINSSFYAQKLIKSNLRHVVHIALSYINYELALNDLIQEGTIGLMKAIKNFKPNRNIRLFTYSIYWIKAEINKYIINNYNIVKIIHNESQKKLFFNLQSIKNNILWLNDCEMKIIAKNIKVNYEDIIIMEKIFTRKKSGNYIF